MTYDLLEAALNGLIRDIFFTINLFSLIKVGQFYYITIDLTVKLNDKETVNRFCF